MIARDTRPDIVSVAYPRGPITFAKAHELRRRTHWAERRAQVLTAMLERREVQAAAARREIAEHVKTIAELRKPCPPRKSDLAKSIVITRSNETAHFYVDDAEFPWDIERETIEVRINPGGFGSVRLTLMAEQVIVVDDATA